MIYFKAKPQAELSAAAEAVWSIAERVAPKHGLSPIQIYRKHARRGIERARQEVMWEGHRQAKLSYPVLGYVMRCHHTTILYAVRAHEARLAAQGGGK